MNTTQSSCKVCKSPDPDLRFLGCGCTIHARCIPMNLLLEMQEANKPYDSILPAANKSSHSICPLCQSGEVGEIFIEPLHFNDVERAIALKKNELFSSGKNRYLSQRQQSRKHAREEDIEIQAESPYLLLSNSNSSISCSGLSRGQQRTGRWTTEESELVDFLVGRFDKGLLPLPHGIKLNEFLGDMLLCKSSRLTKKMKNAKLSTRSFVLGKSSAQFTLRDRETLSMLQDRFLFSLSSEPTRLVLKTNLAKQWRTHFYNICLQIGYPHVQANAWNASLGELEKRATRAEEIVRRIRRRTMGLSPQYEGGNFVNPNPQYEGGNYANQNSASNFIKADQTRINTRTSDLGAAITSVISYDTKCLSISQASIVSNEQKSRSISLTQDEVSNIDYGGDCANNLNSNGHHGRQRSLSTDISISSIEHKPKRGRSFSEDFDAFLDVLTEETNEVDGNYKGKTTTAESIEFSKGSDSVISANSSPSTTVTVKTSQIPMMPRVQCDMKGLSSLSSHNELHTRHYMPKGNNAVSSSDFEGGEDSGLASFLLKNMPVIDNSQSTQQVSSSSDANTLRPYFFSLRLLLLRPINQRTFRENEIVRILKKSFMAYAKDNRRDGKELANLLVKDWVCLKSTYMFQGALIPLKDPYKTEGPLLPIASMAHTPSKPAAVESYKHIPLDPPEVEQRVSSEYQGSERDNSGFYSGCPRL